MLKKTITYTDYNEVERTEDFYFNLSKAELAEMELSVDGGFAEMAKEDRRYEECPELVKLFKELILKAYGEKSADGRRFMKVDERASPCRLVSLRPKHILSFSWNCPRMLTLQPSSLPVLSRLISARKLQPSCPTRSDQTRWRDE